MTFFYNLNKTLDAIREKPELTHKQLNERNMSRAAKGYEKYGKEGMEALAKAGREGKALDPVRAKYDKYNDKSVDEGMGDMAKKVGSMAKRVGGKVLDKLGHGDDAEMMRDLQRKMGVPQTGEKPQQQVKEKMSPAKAKSFAALAEPKDKITFADKIAGAKKEVDEMLGDVAAEAMKSALSGHSTKSLKAASSKDADADRKSGVSPQYSTQQVKGELKRRGEQVADEGNAFTGKLKDTPKGGKFKMGNKEYTDNSDVDEGFPTVASARDEMRKRKVGDVTHGAKHDTEETPTGRRVTRRLDPNTGYSVGADDDKPADGEKRGRGRPKSADKGPERVTANATKHKGGRKAKEVDEGADEGMDMVKLAKVIASCTTQAQLDTARRMAQNFLKKHQTGDLAFYGSDMKRGNAVSKDIASKRDEIGEEELDEKAVSKKQQKFMGMVHATQKGEKAPSKEVAKVAKTMKKDDAEDFASTKHKGLPEKKKPESKSEAPKKKKEKTEEAGGAGTPTASSGFSYGKGIYDSMNHELENMISESMSINVSSSTEGGKNITVTASEEDADKLAAILKSAGLGGDSMNGGSGYKSACGCGQPDCGCSDEMDEAAPAVSDNEPNWPTNQETAQDNFEYSGGLNKPKSTGQTTVPVIASQDERQGTYAEAEEDAIKRMMEMAGVKKKEVDEEKTEEGNLFTGNLAKARADGKKEADLDGDGKMEKVDESILASTANLWSEYKGKYGV